MYITKGVAMTDGKNRKSHIIKLPAIISAYSEQYEKPMIVNLGHDRSKPIGYMMLDGIYMEPGKAYLLSSSYISDTKEENEKLLQMVEILDSRMFCLEQQEKLEELYDCLKGYVTSNAKVAPVGQAVSIIDLGIVKKVFPELFEGVDDGLLDLRKLSPVYKNDSLGNKILVPGVYKKGEFLLFAHRYFRRNMCVANTTNDVFFEKFERLRENENLELKIALDPDMIGLIGTESLEAEYQYWWGPKFNEDLSAIPLGVTCHKNENYDNYFSNLIETQFYWYIQDNIQTFECEEISDKENILFEDNTYYGCRYVHSMVNKETNLPNHLDGAVRIYTVEQIMDRMDFDLSKDKKESSYCKLWRIDSDFNVSTWKELITHFFRDNHLIGEYFGGEDETFAQIKNESNAIKQKNPLDEYIPFDMDRNSGLRILFKYCDYVKIPEDRDAIVKNTLMLTTVERDNIKILEVDTITLLKLLLSKGVRIRKPITPLVEFGDMIINYPCICCDNTEIAETLFEAILELCNAWKTAGDDRLLSFNIKINRRNERNVLLAFAGHIDNFIDLFSSCPFQKNISVEDWILQIYEKNNLFNEAGNYPNKFMLLNEDGFSFKRHFVPKNKIRRVKNENGIYTTELILTQEEAILFDHKVGVAPTYIIKEDKCKKCGQDYRDCNCIKFIQKDVSDIITSYEYIGTIWTKRSAFFSDSLLVELKE